MENQIAEQLGTAVSQLIDEYYEATIETMERADLSAWIVDGPKVVRRGITRKGSTHEQA